MVVPYIILNNNCVQIPAEGQIICFFINLYRESPHKTVNWETENTVLCEIALFQIENKDNAKNSTM